MHRPDHATAVAGRFDDGTGPDDGTVLESKFLNAVLEELVGVVEGSGQTLDDANDGQLLEAVRILAAGLQPFGFRRNLILNGNFDLWQYATSSTIFAAAAAGAAKYLTEGWYCYSGGSVATAFARQTFTPGQTEVPGFPPNYCRLTTDPTAATNQPWIGAAVEYVQNFDARSVTLSLWLKADATVTAGMTFVQGFGAGSASADVDSAEQVFSVGTSWAKYTFNFDLPSVAGKDIKTGSNGRFELRLPQLSSHVLDVAQAQLEYGLAATDFEPVPVEETARRALRYFERSWPGIETLSESSWPNYLGAAGTFCNDTDEEIPGLATRFRAEKVATPGVGWLSPESGAGAKVRLIESGADASLDSGSVPTVYQSTLATGFPVLLNPLAGPENAAVQWYALAPLPI